MNIYEFEELTGCSLTYEQYLPYEERYMNCNDTKQVFCKKILKEVRELTGHYKTNKWDFEVDQIGITKMNKRLADLKYYLKDFIECCKEGYGDEDTTYLVTYQDGSSILINKDDFDFDTKIKYGQIKYILCMDAESNRDNFYDAIVQKEWSEDEELMSHYKNYNCRIKIVDNDCFYDSYLELEQDKINA